MVDNIKGLITIMKEQCNPASGIGKTLTTAHCQVLIPSFFKALTALKCLANDFATNNNLEDLATCYRHSVGSLLYTTVGARDDT
jgi:hypothetical protein